MKRFGIILFLLAVSSMLPTMAQIEDLGLPKMSSRVRVYDGIVYTVT